MASRGSLLVLWGLSFLVSALPRAAGGDWPEFRGPTGQGEACSADLPIKWAADQNITWRTPIPGSGWSSPIVSGDRVYLTTAVQQQDDESEGTSLGPDVLNNAPVANNSTAATLSLRALALDANTGRIVWNREIFSYPSGQYPPGHAKNSFASPTPISDGKLIYAHFGPLGTAALDQEGAIVWRNAAIAYDARHGGAGSPIIAGSALVFNCDGVENPFVVALDLRTGNEMWRTPRQPMDPERFAFSTPLAIPPNGHDVEQQVVSPGSHMVGSYDPVTGRELWHVHFERKWSVIPRPIYADGLVLACTGYDGPAELLAIRPDGSGDVSQSHVAWRHNKFVPHTPSPLVVNGRVFTVSDAGIAACTDFSTGKLLGKKRLGGTFSASPIHAGGRLYFPSESGVCHVVAADPELTVLAKNDLEEPILASFAVAGDALLVRTSGALYRIEENATISVNGN